VFGILVRVENNGDYYCHQDEIRNDGPHQNHKKIERVARHVEQRKRDHRVHFSGHQNKNGYNSDQGIVEMAHEKKAFSGTVSGEKIVSVTVTKATNSPQRLNEEQA
jgi:hypothetical protein